MHRGANPADVGFVNPITLQQLFEILSDATRLNLLALLAGGERNVSDLCAALGLPQPTVSHHLSLLRLRRMVEARREGKRVYYCCSPTVASPAPGVLSIRIDGGVAVSISGLLPSAARQPEQILPAA
jgi:hypothetical protein